MGPPGVVINGPVAPAGRFSTRCRDERDAKRKFPILDFEQYDSVIKRQEISVLKTVRGIYRRGQIELAEDPNLLSESAVLVTFLTDQPCPPHQPIVE